MYVIGDQGPRVDEDVRGGRARARLEQEARASLTALDDRASFASPEKEDGKEDKQPAKTWIRPQKARRAVRVISRSRDVTSAPARDERAHGGRVDPLRERSRLIFPPTSALSSGRMPLLYLVVVSCE